MIILKNKLRKLLCWNNKTFGFFIFFLLVQTKFCLFERKVFLNQSNQSCWNNQNLIGTKTHFCYQNQNLVRSTKSFCWLASNKTFYYPKQNFTGPQNYRLGNNQTSDCPGQNFIGITHFFCQNQNLVASKKNFCWLASNQTFYCPKKIWLGHKIVDWATTKLETVPAKILLGG